MALADAAGRVLGEAVTAGCAVPPFDRASMDGYAVRGEETYGADAYTPAVFHCKGKVRPGRAFEGEVGPGEAVEIATGAPIPAGADTVVPVEATASEGDRVSVHEAVPVGRHIGRAGEDVVAGTLVLPAGRVLRPQDLGVLSGLGVAAVAVVRRPVVTILITGDELLPPGTPPAGHRFADMNSPMLAALVARDGGVARVVGPHPGPPRRRSATPWPTPLRHRTSCSSPAAARPGPRTTRRDSWPSWANSRCTGSRCGRRARPGSGSSGVCRSFSSRATR